MRLGSPCLQWEPMSASSTGEVVRRVEEAPLSELLRISIDDVQVQLESYLHPGMDPFSLYRRWERQQWAVADLDFSADVQDWRLLNDSQRQSLRRTLTLFFMG